MPKPSFPQWYVRMRQHHKKYYGFSLIEILVVIGVIAILSSVVISAINPTAQIGGARDVDRNHTANQIQKAVMQYLIEQEGLPGDSTIPTGEGSAVPICRSGETDAGCINIDEIFPSFLTCNPYDGAEPNSNYSGYDIYQIAGRPLVRSMYLGVTPATEGGCESPPEPIGHWRLDETSIGTVIDESDNNLHGTHTNIAVPYGPSTDTPSGVSFSNPRSVALDNSNDWIAIPNNGALQMTDQLSIVGWIKLNSFGSSDNVDALVRKGEANPNNYQLAVKDRNVHMMLDGDDNGDSVAGSSTLETDKWYHIAGVWDGTDVRIYVDGELDNTPAAHAGPLGTDSRPLYLGGRPTSDLIDGYIDDIRIFNDSLTAGQVKSLALGTY